MKRQAVKRKAPRRRHRLMVRFGPAGGDFDRTGFTHDISPLGLFLVTSHCIEPGQTLGLYLEVDGQSLELTGKVAWCRKASRELRQISASGLGIQLTYAPEAWYHLFYDQPGDDSRAA